MILPQLWFRDPVFHLHPSSSKTSFVWGGHNPWTVGDGYPENPEPHKARRSFYPFSSEFSSASFPKKYEFKKLGKIQLPDTPQMLKWLSLLIHNLPSALSKGFFTGSGLANSPALTVCTLKMLRLPRKGSFSYQAPGTGRGTTAPSPPPTGKPGMWYNPAAGDKLQRKLPCSHL